MRISQRIYDALIIFLLMIVIWVGGAGGGMMEKKMMKWMMDKHSGHHGESKGLSLGFKAVAIPIPIPILTKEKGDSQPEKPWMAESKDMFWKMMMMKMMKGGKGDKGKAAPMMCCPQQMQMQNGWPMMMMKAMMKSMKMMKAKKAQPTMMCCPQMMQMMKGMNGCSMMMNGGWPPPPSNTMCGSAQNGGGWPDEEPEEEPDYYEEEPMMGWDTMNMPEYVALDGSGYIKSKSVSRRKGDPLHERYLIARKKRTTDIFRKSLSSRNSFENDFD